MGDGECQEGQIWEAAMSAAHFKLGRLIGIIDRNQVSVGGETEKILALEPLKAKWEAFGWEVRQLDGHDFQTLLECFEHLPPVTSDIPTLIIASTISGKGVRSLEGSFAWHLGYLAPEDAEKALAELREGGAE
jgi:transketolase